MAELRSSRNKGSTAIVFSCFHCPPKPIHECSHAQRSAECSEATANGNGSPLRAPATDSAFGGGGKVYSLEYATGICEKRQRSGSKQPKR